MWEDYPWHFGTRDHLGWDTPLPESIHLDEKTLATLRDVRQFVLSLSPGEKADWGVAIVRMITAAQTPTEINVELALKGIKGALQVTGRLRDR